jgi:hypothetical protein
MLTDISRYCPAVHHERAALFAHRHVGALAGTAADDPLLFMVKTPPSVTDTPPRW